MQDKDTIPPRLLTIKYMKRLQDKIDYEYYGNIPNLK